MFSQEKVMIPLGLTGNKTLAVVIVWSKKRINVIVPTEDLIKGPIMALFENSSKSKTGNSTPCLKYLPRAFQQSCILKSTTS